LDGLEPDNLLAFLALLGLLRSLEAVDINCPDDRKLRPRTAWDIDVLPLRPVLHVARASTQQQITEAAIEGVKLLSADYEFQGQTGLNYSGPAARELLSQEAEAASISSRSRADVLAALMTDAAIKREKKSEAVDPTPFCLLFGQGRQYFLDRLSKVPREP